MFKPYYLGWLFLAALSYTSVVAQPPPSATEAQAEIPDTALAQASAVARRFEVRRADQVDSDQVVPPIERPLLLFGDDPRNLTRGILWGWGAGRPVAVAELWRGRAESAPYAVSFTLSGLDLIA